MNRSQAELLVIRYKQKLVRVLKALEGSVYRNFLHQDAEFLETTSKETAYFAGLCWRLKEDKKCCPSTSLRIPSSAMNKKTNVLVVKNRV